MASTPPARPARASSRDRRGVRSSSWIPGVVERCPLDSRATVFRAPANTRSLDAESSRAMGKDLASIVLAFGEASVPSEARSDVHLRWYRGEPLNTRDADTRDAIDQCRKIAGLSVDLDAVVEVWDSAMALPDQDSSSTNEHWYHGDLVGENLLTRDTPGFRTVGLRRASCRAANGGSHRWLGCAGWAGAGGIP